MVRYSPAAEKLSNFTPVRGRLVLCLRSDDERCDIDIEELEEDCRNQFISNLTGYHPNIKTSPMLLEGKLPWGHD